MSKLYKSSDLKMFKTKSYYFGKSEHFFKSRKMQKKNMGYKIASFLPNDKQTNYAQRDQRMQLAQGRCIHNQITTDNRSL
jgi:hypothetical protein